MRWLTVRVWWTVVFFFNDTATTEIYPLSLHDALPIWTAPGCGWPRWSRRCRCSTAARSARSRPATARGSRGARRSRSEEHTSELQSRQYLVCRLLLENKENDLCTLMLCMNTAGLAEIA